MKLLEKVKSDNIKDGSLRNEEKAQNATILQNDRGSSSENGRSEVSNVDTNSDQSLTEAQYQTNGGLQGSYLSQVIFFWPVLWSLLAKNGSHKLTNHQYSEIRSFFSYPSQFALY